MPRPFKVPLYPLPVVIAIIVYSIVMIAALWRDPVPSVVGALMIASGLVYYSRLKNVS